MYCSKLQSWSQQGKFAELPLELSLHATTCPTCSRFLAEVEQARRWVEKASVHRVPMQRLDNIEVVLRAEARLSRRGARSVPSQARWRVGAAAAVLLLASAGAAAAWLAKRPTVAVAGVQPSTDSPQVVVTLAPGARGHADPHFPQSSYSLDAGEGDFDVGRFPGGRLFCVKSGPATVKARDAHFRVRVQSGRIEHLYVAKGEVTLEVPGASPVVLGQGKALDWSAKPGLTGLAPVGPVADSATASVPTTTARPIPRARPMAEADARRRPSASGPPVPDDTAFAHAFALLDSGRARDAAVAFDDLVSRGQLDPQRRADVLYWSSQAHARAGNRSLAETRAFGYISSYPNGLHATDAALLLGDYARDKKQYALSRRYYENALRSGRPTTAARAKLALSQLPQ